MHTLGDTSKVISSILKTDLGTIPIGNDAPRLTVIIPTKNEAGNVCALLDRIDKALAGISVEVLFVDDSSDNTPQVIRSQSRRYECLNVNLIHRPESKRDGGLGGAVVEGMRAANSPWLCVMDGDLQHPPEIINKMFDRVEQDGVDLVVASRRTASSEASKLGFMRNLISLGLDGIARMMFFRALRGVSDPLTGFFMVRLGAIDLNSFRPKGFKILLEILVRNPHLKRSEVSFEFGSRHTGNSKASVKEVMNYFNLLASLRFGEEWLRVVSFGLVGLSGIIVNMLTMALTTTIFGVHYLVSAIIATLTSSTWNFILMEYWVFRAGQQPSGRLYRYLLYFAVNNVALLFRTPMIYVFTALLGFHYLVSNLITLLIFFVVRYSLSSRWIWRRRGQPDFQAVSSSYTNQGIFSTEGSIQMSKINYYDLHNVISIASDTALPELQPFLVNHKIEKPTIEVKIGKPEREPRPQLLAEDPYVRHLYYREMFGRLGFEAEINIGKRISITGSRVLQISPHVLYTNLIEPILRWAFVERGYALVHGATITFEDKAYMITAQTDTGKTTTLLKILNKQRRESDKVGFISDDMTLISPDGRVMGYPKPLTISHHTIRALSPNILTKKERFALFFQSRIHSRSGRKFAFLLGQSKFLPMATINAITQLLIPPPKYPVERLIPKVKFSPSAYLAGLFIIERGEEAEVSMDTKKAIEILLRNCEDAYGFPPYDLIKERLYFANGTDLRVLEQSIIKTAFADLPATLFCNNDLAWWQRIPRHVDQELGKFFDYVPESAGVKDL